MQFIISGVDRQPGLPDPDLVIVLLHLPDWHLWQPSGYLRRPQEQVNAKPDQPVHHEPGQCGHPHVLLLRTVHTDPVVHRQVALRRGSVHALSRLPRHLDLHLDHDHDHHRTRPVRCRLLSVQAKNAGQPVNQFRNISCIGG